MKDLEVTFADNLLQTCRLLFETCVRIGYFIHSGVFVCFYQIVYALRVPGYPKISNFGYPVPEITENAKP